MDVSRQPGSGTSAARTRDMLSLLNTKEGLLIALLESAAQAVISVDRTGRIVLVNSRTEEMFGYERGELLGAGIDMLLPESKRGIHARQRAEYFSHPRVRPMGIGMELSGRRKNGRQFPVEVSLSYVETAEGVFAIAFVSDISQRKQLEEQLIHSQKMEAVGRLAGGVAHDFNNMLTVIAGYNRMILDELEPSSPIRAFAEEVLKASDRAAALTNQLLTFSRRQIVKPSVVNLSSIVGQTEKMLRRLIGEDIELVLSLSPDTGNIQADPGQIEHAIVNLAVNSRDAMPRGGRLTIETANARLDETYARTHIGVKPGEFVMVAVSDTGEGMDADTRRLIFEPFFTTKPKGKGTGLGLATVYGMVKQAGGDVWVYSELGKGTTFKLYFPRLMETAADTKNLNAPAPKPDGHETILVVEDENAVRELTVKILERLGYRVLAASSGEEAVDISRGYAGAIDLLMTDVVMPNMSGSQLAAALAETRPATKVLYLSGYTENTVAHHGALEPGVDFLPKPFTRELLAKKVRDVLNDRDGKGLPGPA